LHAVSHRCLSPVADYFVEQRIRNAYCAILYYIILYLLLTAIGLMPGGSVYRDHTFNKETTHTSHEIVWHINVLTLTLTTIYGKPCREICGTFSKTFFIV
jgi:p-aminobenzoyl-glutamate transporter AbgT